MGRWVGLPVTEVDFYPLAVIVEEVKPVASSGKAESGEESESPKCRGGSGLQLSHVPEIGALSFQDSQG